MAKYKTIKGYSIQSVTTDPVASPIAAGTWASSPVLNNARANLAGAGTTVDTAVFFGGSPSPAETEKYDGSSWTESGDLQNGRGQLMGCGTQTAALAAGGGPGSRAETEEFNGSTWSEESDMNSGRNSGYAAGTQTAALVFSGGIWNQPTLHKLVEEYNGTSWTVKTALTSSHMTNVNGIGVVSTAAICSSGYYYPPPSATALTEEWNGSSWSEVSDLNTARYYCAGAGSTTAGIVVGGETPSTLMSHTEYFDGSSWTEVGDLGAPRSAHAGSSRNSPATSAIVGGGNPAPNVTTETWSVPSTISLAQEGQVWYNSTGNVLKGYRATVGTGTWAAGGALNNGRTQLGGTGSQSATLAFFGAAPGVYPSGATKYVEQYDGTSWTNLSDANSERYNGASIGQTTTDAAYAGGYGAPPPPLQSGKTEKWNGSSWTESGDLVSGRQGFFGGSGTTTAGLVAGSGPADGATEIFNGSTWAEEADLVTARQYAPVTGATQTAAMCVGGYGIPAASPYSNGPGSRVGLTEIWNGTSWTQSANTLVLGRIEAGLSGTTSLSVIAGGSTGDPAPPTVNTASAETWDGTSWTSVAAMGDAVVSAGSSRTGGSTSAILFGGSPGDVATSEEWTVPDTTYGIKTFTAS